MEDKCDDPDEETDELGTGDGLSLLLRNLGSTFIILLFYNSIALDFHILCHNIVNNLHNKRVSITQEKKAGSSITCFHKPETEPNFEKVSRS